MHVSVSMLETHCSRDVQRYVSSSPRCVRVPSSNAYLVRDPQRVLVP